MLKQMPLYLFLCLAFQLSAQENVDSIARLNLLFVGDIMGHRPQISSAQVIKDKKFNYEPVFQFVQPLIEKADLAIANLEVTLPGEPPYQGYPNFRSPDDLANALRLAGFDVLVTANNHSNDAKGQGVIHTIDVLEQNGFYQTGTFKNKLDRDLFYPLIVYKNGFKLAFLNYTYDTNNMKTVPPTMVNEIKESLIKKDMEVARRLNPDFIIVMMHWGKEYQLEENKRQQQLSKMIFEAGADLIIGSHPHVIQPIKESTVMQADSSEKKVLVTYSLGNFISNQKKLNTDGGLVFEIELCKNLDSNTTYLGAYHYWPVWRYIHRANGKTTYHVLPIAAFENNTHPELKLPAKDLAAMKKFAKEMGAHLEMRNLKLEMEN